MVAAIEHPWDQGLQGAARRIAETPDTPLRALAGPGTGKTFCLMRRVARLLQEGTNPRRILVSTFTRTSAVDLKRSLAELGVDGANDVQADTLHSQCFRLLQREDVFAITGRTPRPLLPFEQRFLLEDLKFADLGGIRECTKLLKAFAAAWARLQSEDPGWPETETDKAFQSHLLRWLVFHESMLIEELVTESFRYLRDNPTSPVLHEFNHVLVDEYQDLNRASQSLVDLLASNASLTIIGDEDQSIYGFNYAHPEGIRDFADSHPGTHDESLEECRRCGTRIVDIANSLIANNASRADRTLRHFPGNPPGEVHVIQWNSPTEETTGIAEIIANRIELGDVEAGEVLVLTPSRRFGYQIRNRLNELGVDALSFFQEQVLRESSEAQERLTLLHLLTDSNDRVSLRCWIGFGSGTLNSNAWSRIRSESDRTGEAPRKVLDDLASGARTLPYTKPAVERYLKLLEELDRLNGLTGQALVDALFPEGAEWADPFRTIATAIRTEDFSAAQLHDALTRAITQPELPTEVPYVRVMSLHKSKGLTAQFVVIAGCTDGLIPRIDQAEPPEVRSRTLEEQRRLFYVAITRPKSTLIISSFTRIPIGQAYQIGAAPASRRFGYANFRASRFIAELGPSAPASVSGQQLLAHVGGPR